MTIIQQNKRFVHNQIDMHFAYKSIIFRQPTVLK